MYHINITTENLELIKQKFGDVKFVCLAGSQSRVQKFAQMCYDELKDVYDIPADAATDDIAIKAGRLVLYELFKFISLSGTPPSRLAPCSPSIMAWALHQPQF